MGTRFIIKSIHQLFASSSLDLNLSKLTCRWVSFHGFSSMPIWGLSFSVVFLAYLLGFGLKLKQRGLSWSMLKEQPKSSGILVGDLMKIWHVSSLFNLFVKFFLSFQLCFHFQANKEKLSVSLSQSSCKGLFGWEIGVRSEYEHIQYLMFWRFQKENDHFCFFALIFNILAVMDSFLLVFFNEPEPNKYYISLLQTIFDEFL